MDDGWMIGWTDRQTDRYLDRQIKTAPEKSAQGFPSVLSVG